MTYDFDQIIDRRGTNSYKYDHPGEQDVVQLWVADMDFAAAPPIRAALQRCIDHGIFGYTRVPDAYYQSVVRWFEQRHQWHIEPSWIQYTTGVVPATSVAVKAFCQPGDKVILQTPAYNCFFSSIRNNGCQLLENPLHYEEGRYTINFDDLERKAADSKANALILCNPHNPTGRLWTREELSKINEICLRHHIVVLADEIHNELTYNGSLYVPFASVSPDCQANSVVFTSPTKSFNIAGLQIANIICSNSEWRSRIDRAININEVCDVNPFGIVALQAAYNEGAPWLDALCSYIWGNYQALVDFLAHHLPQLHACPLEATYLAWVDIKALGIKSVDLTQQFLDQARVRVSPGTLYGDPSGEGFIRINLATPRANLLEGLSRINKYLTR